MAKGIEVDKTELIQLTINSMTKEQYAALVELSGDKLSTELSNQLFMTSDDDAGREAILSSQVFDAIYPIGSIYIAVSPTLPAAFSENGRRWTKLAAGRCLWSAADEDQLCSTIPAGLPLPTVVDDGHQHTFSAWSHGESEPSLLFTSGKDLTMPEFVEFETDAVFSNISISADSIYGNSGTVQPPAIGVSMWVRDA